MRHELNSNTLKYFMQSYFRHYAAPIISTAAICSLLCSCKLSPHRCIESTETAAAPKKALFCVTLHIIHATNSRLSCVMLNSMKLSCAMLSGAGSVVLTELCDVMLMFRPHERGCSRCIAPGPVRI